ncbi:MAG: hypothetical protein JWL63_2678 [Rhodocyclales bacterium]|nr:hypothetical protein [Rhodocyclales bacterium]
MHLIKRSNEDSVRTDPVKILPTIHTATVELIKTAENVVFGEKRLEFSLLDNAWRHIAHPPKVIILGADVTMKTVLRWVFVSAAMIFLYAVAAKFVPVDANAATTQATLGYFALVAALVWTLFTTPSTFAVYPLQQKAAVRLFKVLDEYEIESRSRLNAVQANLKIIEDRVKSRVLKLNAILTLSWGGFVFLFNHTLQTAEKYSTPTKPMDISQIVLYAFALFFGYFLIDCYAKGNARIFRTLDMALNETEE